MVDAYLSGLAQVLTSRLESIAGLGLDFLLPGLLLLLPGGGGEGEEQQKSEQRKYESHERNASEDTVRVTKL